MALGSRTAQMGDFITSRVLGINTNERYEQQPADMDKMAHEMLDPADIFTEQEPSVGEFIRELAPTRAGAARYIEGLFPSASWLRRYCLQWLLGDCIAGLTIGLVVVPQAMAYASLAQLTPAYGLYTSFTGACCYWLFGTSKDIVIGATAVGSLLVGQVVSRVQEEEPGRYTNHEIAHCLSLLAGSIMLFFGLFRLGWIIEFIPYIPISAFVTAASITIMSTQVPVAMGIPDINTRDSPYKVIINTLRGLPNTKIDAVIGLTSIVLLFAIRDFCAMMEERMPTRKRTWSLLSSLRMTFVMLLFTLISWLLNRSRELDDSPFRIVGHIDAGFQKAGVPKPDARLATLILPELPAICIILIIEHIAISKSMGRIYNYTVVPSQEIVALGAANLFSPFVGGYVCTGSFGASAVLSKAGVRTPLAGFFSACILLLALYALTAVFQYIPNSALAGLIIHAVCNLITPPKNLYKYWQLSPLELLIWALCVILAVFESLETSIYVGIALSFAILLVRLARTNGQFMGRVSIRRVSVGDSEKPRVLSTDPSKGSNATERAVYLPLERRDASNPAIQVVSPYPGVFIYRFREGFNYTNQAMHVAFLSSHIKNNTRRASEEHFEKESDRPWNDPGPKARKHDKADVELPLLRALVLDFSAVNNLDVTCVQGLVDLRNTLDRHCAPDAVEMHFANVHNRWSRRALAAAGFGYPPGHNETAVSSWQPAYTIAAILEPQVVETRPASHDEEASVPPPSPSDERTLASSRRARPSTDRAHMAATTGVDRPFFHIDLSEAVDAAVRDAQFRDGQLEEAS